MVVELVLPHVSCRPFLVSTPTKHDGGCTAGCHSWSPPSGWLALGVTLGSCWWRCRARGPCCCSVLGRSRALVRSGALAEESSPRMLLQGLREPVSGCGCLRFAIPVGLITELLVCIVGFHENSEHWPSAGHAPDLRTHCPCRGLQHWVSVQVSPTFAHSLMLRADL